MLIVSLSFHPCTWAGSTGPESSARDWPLWAYGVTTPPQPGDTAKPQGAPGPRFRTDLSREEQLRPLQIEGSSRRYTMLELSDWQHTPDWFPEEHGPVPVAVSRGPESLGDQTRACGFCHRIHGGGRPENAPVFGLPVAYFLRQIEDFRAGRRHSSDPRKPNVPTMTALVRALSDEEASAVAEFYAAQSGGPPLRVIESERAPPVRLHGNLFVKISEDASEALADRILEVPEDFEKSGKLDDPRSGYVAYVPVGSIARGRTLVENGPLPCATCHGGDLTGSGDAPPIAGRSPSYIVRQLQDFKTGARNGSLAALMQPVVADLGPDEMLAISAYLASLPRTSGAGQSLHTDASRALQRRDGPGGRPDAGLAANQSRTFE
jgi:cytochrome c553